MMQIMFQGQIQEWFCELRHGMPVGSLHNLNMVTLTLKKYIGKFLYAIIED